MTVGTGFVLALVATVILVFLFFLFEDFELVQIMIVLLDFVVGLFWLIVVVFWFWAMVDNNINPFEALSYQMWD